MSVSTIPGAHPGLQRPEKHTKHPKRISKQQGEIQRRYNEARLQYDQSSWSSSTEILLSARNRPTVTKIVSLGLGSLYEKSRDQPRRLKQLAMLLSVADYLRSTSTPEITVYAQDPSFTKADEAFLRSLDIQILKTPSPSDLGEAGHIIDDKTMLYSPFLTIAAYELLLKSRRMDLLLGDDLNALRSKWEKGTTEHKQVELLMKSGVSQYQRRNISGEGFWGEDDRYFPMALYWRQRQRVKGQVETQKEGTPGQNVQDPRPRDGIPRARL
ncbi:hypothetical protein PG995_009916 [Apiospora arundinis]|uniref:SRR1-like domain-containing protein n=1 Tax=Apiospora arundinis TaxID=335852 RepID=A0ABR2ITT1_9PEZI